MLHEWLLEECTVDDIEKESMEELLKYRPDWVGTERAVPFGASSQVWEELKSKMLPGDKIYSFRSDNKSWASLAGRQGYSLVRDGKIISNIITRIS